MTNPRPTLERPPRHAAIALGVGGIVVALAIGGATWHQSKAPLGHPPEPSASPPVRSAPSPVAAVGDLRSGRPSAPSRPTGTPTPTRAADVPALDPPPKPGPFTIDLYDKGDFVSQARADWCVPASILSMMNMIDVERDQTTPTQAKLDRLARRLSTSRLRGAGSEPEGWAGSLNRLGYGPYEVREEPTRAAAIAAAARSLRLTGRPVGLLMWRGAHSWVMSGFRATADPAYTDDFEVTHVFVVDPWYPRVSSIWGRAQAPGATVPVRRLAEDYLAWRRPAVRYPEKDGKYVLVVPVVETHADGADHRYEPDDRARR